MQSSLYGIGYIGGGKFDDPGSV